MTDSEHQNMQTNKGSTPPPGVMKVVNHSTRQVLQFVNSSKPVLHIQGAPIRRLTLHGPSTSATSLNGHSVTRLLPGNAPRVVFGPPSTSNVTTMLRPVQQRVLPPSQLSTMLSSTNGASNTTLRTASILAPAASEFGSYSSSPSQSYSNNPFLGKPLNSMDPTHLSGQYDTDNVSTMLASKKKKCHCTKSQCLKLYCECFANSEFCSNCNCNNCHNTLDQEESRNKAMKQCLERNPLAFHPKIGKDIEGERRHQKGCHCKRSGCLKNYCECYEAKIMCTSACKCSGCRNCENPDNSYYGIQNSSSVSILSDGTVEVSPRKTASFESGWGTSSSNLASASHSRIGIRTPQKSYLLSPSVSWEQTDLKLPHKLFTQEVIDATCACMVAVAEDVQSSRTENTSSSSTSRGNRFSSVVPSSSLTPDQIASEEQAVLEEFGRCVTQIIEFSYKPMQK